MINDRSSLLELHVSVLDPACLAKRHCDQGSEHGGKYEGDQDQADPVHCRDGSLCPGRDVRDPTRVHTDLADKTAGSHSGSHRAGGIVHLKAEDTSRDRACDRGYCDRRDPDPGVLDDIAHLQHGSSDSLGDQAAPLILLKGHDGETDHLRAASCHRGSSGKAGQSQRRADRGGRDGKRKSDADHDGNNDSHQERLQVGRPHDDRTDARCGSSDRGSDQGGESDACENRHKRSDEDVDPGLLGDRFAAFRGDDRDKQNSKRAACAAAAAQSRAAQRVGRVTDCREGEQDQGRSLQGIADGDCHSGAAHGRGVSAAQREGGDPQLGAQRVQDRADQQGSE